MFFNTKVSLHVEIPDIVILRKLESEFAIKELKVDEEFTYKELFNIEFVIYEELSVEIPNTSKSFDS